MEAWVLQKNGSPENAFVLKEMPDPPMADHEVRLEVDAFGINYADIMARLGLYQDCPPLPTIIGYEVVGKVKEMGKDVKDLEIGQRVVGFTRFGGYSREVVTDQRAVAAIPDSMSSGEAAALATQYCTAWFSACEVTNIHPDDHVLIQAAAGGVGTALVQIAKNRGATVWGTAGSPAKLDYLREQGVDHPINYNREDFESVIKRDLGAESIDIAFDSIGGSTMRKGFKLLANGGRMVCYGAADVTGPNKMIRGLKLVVGFGIYHPIQLMMGSRGLIGVNMLRIADNKPDVLKRCLDAVVAETTSGRLKPHVGKVFAASDLAEAHHFVAERKSVGKVVLEW